MGSPIDPFAAPKTIGAAPVNGFDVNQRIGKTVRDFLSVQTAVSQDQDWLLGADLKADPYNFTAAQETDIKTAISSLDTSLKAIDMTFVNRLIGLV